MNPVGLSAYDCVLDNTSLIRRYDRMLHHACLSLQYNQLLPKISRTIYSFGSFRVTGKVNSLERPLDVEFRKV